MRMRGMGFVGPQGGGPQGGGQQGGGQQEKLEGPGLAAEPFKHPINTVQVFR